MRLLVALAGTLVAFAVALKAESADLPLPGGPVALPGRAVPGEADLVQSAYRHSSSPLLWVSHGDLTLQAVALLRALARCDERGLRPEDYGVDAIRSLASSGNRDDLARLDTWLSTAAVRLLSHLHYGRVDPRTADFELPARPRDLDVAVAVAALASAADVDAEIAAVEPQFYHYALLEGALARYRALAAKPRLTELPTAGKPAPHLGASYAGAPALRDLLIAEGDLAATAAPDSSPVIDAPLAHALKRYQVRHGLSVDGTLNGPTLAALTTPMSRRVRQIELTLERWRWLPPFESPPIVVNIPEFRLFAFRTTADRAASILQMPVIVGQAYPAKRTPIFVGEMRTVVFRPYWDVPRSIVLKEMLPRIRENPDYLAHEHLQLVRGEGDDAPIVAPSAQAVRELAAGALRLRQLPGNDNALGLIKFLFPNAHNVYLHSTPAYRLFAASRRAFSHGCIRVSDPTALALYVLNGVSPPWDAARIDAEMHADTRAPLRVELPKPIPVMVLYGTAMATEAGPVQFFDDLYGHDRKLERLLGLAPLERARVAGALAPTDASATAARTRAPARGRG